MPINEAYLNYLLECQRGVLAEVVLINPDANEKQRGVCRVYLAGEQFLIPSGTDRVSAYLRLDSYHGRLLIHFLDCSLSAEVREKHFSSGSFLMKESYPIGGTVARELGLAEGDYWINAGSYPVLDDGELLTISASVGRLIALSSSSELRIAA